MTAATDAPTVIAVAVRCYAHVYRSGAQLDTAENVLAPAAGLLRPDHGGEHRSHSLAGSRYLTRKARRGSSAS
ncbi:MAG: hypothetical protein ACRDSR_13675 [Pseudonocardiaceae bacterium]